MAFEYQFYIFADLMWFENATIHYYINAGCENPSRSDGTSYVKSRLSFLKIDSTS